MPKRILQGVVVSQDDKTVVVRVERRFAHPLLQKTVRRSKKFKAVDTSGSYEVGDVVSVEAATPFVMDKSWGILGPDGKVRDRLSPDRIKEALVNTSRAR